MASSVKLMLKGSLVNNKAKLYKQKDIIYYNEERKQFK